MNRVILVVLTVTLLLANRPATFAQQNSMTTSTGIEMVWIPPGEFLMGSTAQEQAWAISNNLPPDIAKTEGESPRRARITQGFWLGRTEITVGQWRRFVDATRYLSEAEKNGAATTLNRTGNKWETIKGVSWRDPRFDTKPKDNYPVCCISWNDAVAYCEWLTETEKKAKRLPAGMICRLPTEAEWEYACRAGSQTKFWWGEMPAAGDRRLNWVPGTEKFSGPAPVDHYRAKGRNRFGLADMLGNLAEWCLDQADPACAHEECYKGKANACVLRGGSFSQGVEHCRCAARRLMSPASTTTQFGFRVAIGAPR